MVTDIFISHSSQDAAWATAIHNALRQRLPAGTRFFLDSASLAAGDDWELKIDEAMRTTQHLVVLWSSAARDSTWVQREINSFSLLARPMADPTRRLVIVNLEGRYEARGKIHQLAINELQKSYPDASAIPAATWTAVAQQLEQALNPDKTLVEVPLVVLSASKAQLDTMPAERRSWIEGDYMIEYKDLLPQYDAAPAGWRPFASSTSVATILDSVRTEVNASLARHIVTWKEPPAEFWTSTKAAKEFVDRQFRTGELSVLIVDPVSIAHPDIYQRLMYFQDCLLDSRTVIIAMAPFALMPGVARLRASLLDRGSPYFDDYFRPIVPPRRKVLAQCCWNATDGDDIQRYILAAAGHLDQDPGGSSRSAFVSHGPTR
jgi:hypothetical protein